MRFPVCEKGGPRNITAENQIGRIVEDGAFEPPVIEEKPAGFDQIDSHPEARCKPQQGPGILRDIRFEQSETHTISADMLETV